MITVIVIIGIVVFAILFMIFIWPLMAMASASDDQMRKIFEDYMKAKDEAILHQMTLIGP